MLVRILANSLARVINWGANGRDGRSHGYSFMDLGMTTLVGNLYIRG